MFTYLFALPIEIRSKIYSFALFSYNENDEDEDDEDEDEDNDVVNYYNDANKTSVQKFHVYDSQHGFSSIHVSTALLRANTQIHNEARPLLYSFTTFQITLTAPCTIAPSVKALPEELRLRPRPRSLMTTTKSYTRPDNNDDDNDDEIIGSAVPEVAAVRKEGAQPGAAKVLTRRTLARLKNVEVVVSTAAFWLWNRKLMRMTGFSRAGDCFCEILSALAIAPVETDGEAGNPKERRGRLRVVVEPGWGNSHLLQKRWEDDDRSLFRFEREGVVEEAVEEMLTLLEAVRRVRQVEIVDRGFSGKRERQARKERKKIRWEETDEGWRKVVEDIDVKVSYRGL